eukprot:COSAG01_NODE_713_length_14097_cov_15.136448_7_plen_160_part_00
MISINLYEIFLQMLNFGILLFLVNKFLIRPVHKVLLERSEAIKGKLDHASSMKEDAEKLLTEQQDSLKTARVEAKEIRQRAEDAASDDRKRVMNQAQDDASRLMDNAKKEISLQVVRAKKVLLDEVGQSAVALSSQLLKRNLNAEDQASIIAQGVKQFN